MSSCDAMGGRDAMLARIRAATVTATADAADATAATSDAPEPPRIARDYRPAHVPDDPATLVDVLAANLTDYRARVEHSTEAELPDVLARLLAEHGSRNVAVPEGLPPHWLDQTTGIVQHHDDHDTGGGLTARYLDAIDSVVTGCRLAIAETGTIVLDTGPGQGRRALTLVPDHHICIVRSPEQIVASLPHALPRLDPRRPLTWISGPSATSDIELERVEGVHGPRVLDVVLVVGHGHTDV